MQSMCSYIGFLSASQARVYILFPDRLPPFKVFLLVTVNVYMSNHNPHTIIIANLKKKPPLCRILGIWTLYQDTWGEIFVSSSILTFSFFIFHRFRMHTNRGYKMAGF